MKPGVRAASAGGRALSWLGLFCGVLLGGCAVLGPDYQEPKVEWLADWQPTLYGQVGAGEGGGADLRFWWRTFGDPALNALMDAARRDSPSLRLAGLRILESRALLGIAGSALYPQLQQLGGSAAYAHSRRRGGGQPSLNQDLATYQVGFNLGWELDFWGRFRRGVESADAGYFNSIANQHDAQVLLAAQVAELYFGYRTTELRIKIARENATIQHRSYEIAERRYRSGADSELDLQQAKTQYLATLAAIPQLESALASQSNALCALLGRPPGRLPEVAESLERLPLVATTQVSDLPARLLLRRPDLRAAAWQVAAQSAQIGIAEADYYPSISLLGSIGWSGSSLSASPDSGTLGIGPSLTWNLFDHGRIANNVRVQDARLQQLIEAYRLEVLQAAREVDDAANSVVKTREKAGVLAQSVQASRRALELANTLYQEGYVDFQRVLDAQRALFSQTDAELVNQGGHVNAVVALYKSLGGGWTPATAGALIPAEIGRAMQHRTDWGGLLDAPLPDTEIGTASDE